MTNKKILDDKGSDKWFLRNPDSIDEGVKDKVINLIKINNLKLDKILELGCSNGNKLNLYSQLLKSKINYGVDLSKKATLNGKKRYKNLKLLNISSLEINKIKINFDLIICGFFLYHLDRKFIFHQFDLIYKKLNKSGYLLINDFDPLFKHSNKDHNQKGLVAYKMSYDNFLVESGLFELIYKCSYEQKTQDKSNFKSKKISFTLFKKIDFKNQYPENT